MRERSSAAAARPDPEPRRVVHSLEQLSAEAFVSLGAMEGLYEPIVEPSLDFEPADRAIHESHWPGYSLSALTAAAAYALHYLPVPPFTVGEGGAATHPISAAIIAIVLGVLIRNLLPVPDSLGLGCKRIVHRLIPIAIVLIGAGLDLGDLARVGPRALGITLACMTVAMAAAFAFGRLLGLGRRLAMLIGVGTSVCGTSAIMAVAPLIEAEEDDLVLSVATVNLFGLIVMLLCPLLGGLLAVGDAAFGVWAGTSIHAVPQVVAAGFAYSAVAGPLATLVKLVRVALLAPLVFLLAMIFARHHETPGRPAPHFMVHYARLVPWFVWGFVGMAALASFGLFPVLHFPDAPGLADAGGARGLALAALLPRAGKVLLTLAMAAIGLEVNARLLAGVGSRAVLTGLLASATLLVTSLGLIRLFL